MIVSKTVQTVVSNKLINHYQSLGYVLPTYKPYHNRNTVRIKSNPSIKVLVEHLPIKSHTKVICRCDECGKEKELMYVYAHEYTLCQSCRQAGERNLQWNRNLTDEERATAHHISGINHWKKYVKERDNYTCQKCGSRKNVQAHHINNFKHFKDQRLNINNGISLCFRCHLSKGNSIHSLFGYETTEKHLKEFLLIC